MKMTSLRMQQNNMIKEILMRLCNEQEERREIVWRAWSVKLAYWHYRSQQNVNPQNVIINAKNKIIKMAAKMMPYTRKN